MSRLPLAGIFLLVCCGQLVTTQRSFLDMPLGVQLVRAVRNWMADSIGSTGDKNGDLYWAVQKQGKVQDPVPENVPFPCNITAGRSESVPTSVDRLRPGDIDVIGAMGDSLTAGFGAFGSDMKTIFIENRGVTSLGGGQGTWRDTLTIPNILKAFNPKLFGYCRKDAWNHEPAAEFNVAESASMSRDMPFMAEILIKRMKNDPRVDIKNHWKLVSLFNGANDFCSDMCWNPSPQDTVKNHKTDLIKVLRTLRDNLPRTLVSIVSAPHIRPVKEQKGRSRLCKLTFVAECSCLTGRQWRDQLQEFYDIMFSFQRVDDEVAAYPEFHREDFSVVVQPLFTDYAWPTVANGNADFRYMSADCFHFSQLGNARMTYSLWRNMLEPVGKKSRFWTDIGVLPCPTEERPYIATMGNS
ncbi:phospholipase B1, membrane-associated-like [Diachasmimorpha longicaudata]|uniref:phospholipase B1, membrane-associated-like n=1 Tax=Diachasmimorpha longicaudata TaxID=58733 RepID=UPI0030B881D9